MVTTPRPSTRVQYIPDDLWDLLVPILQRYDPRWTSEPGAVVTTAKGPRRTDSRQVLEAILYREETGCGWNNLPSYFPDDLVVYRRWRYWQETNNLLTKLYQAILRYYGGKR